jgi:hypothetical protein
MNGPPANQISVRQLDPRSIQLCREGNGLQLMIDETSPPTPVTVVRAFPLTEPDRYWVFHDLDGQEIGIVVDPTALDRALYQLARVELERHYFMPTIQRILSVAERRGELEWSVETSRGPCQFTTRRLREVTLQPTAGRYLIRDVTGNRYNIENLNTLDKRSQLMLMTHM